MAQESRTRKKVITPNVQGKVYTVVVDQILGAVSGDAEARPDQLKALSGQVTGADLVAAGCDVQWLMEIGSIQELGFTV